MHKFLNKNIDAVLDTGISDNFVVVNINISMYRLTGLCVLFCVLRVE